MANMDAADIIRRAHPIASPGCGGLNFVVCLSVST